MQWKAIYFNEEDGKKNQTESKRLKSNKCPGRKVDELTSFGSDIIVLVRKIKFRNLRSYYLRKLQENIKRLEHQVKL